MLSFTVDSPGVGSQPPNPTLVTCAGMAEWANALGTGCTFNCYQSTYTAVSLTATIETDVANVCAKFDVTAIQVRAW